jgi:hypothetical protein
MISAIFLLWLKQDHQSLSQQAKLHLVAVLHTVAELGTELQMLQAQ